MPARSRSRRTASPGHSESPTTPQPAGPSPLASLLCPLEGAVEGDPPPRSRGERAPEVAYTRPSPGTFHFRLCLYRTLWMQAELLPVDAGRASEAEWMQV